MENTTPSPAYLDDPEFKDDVIREVEESDGSWAMGFVDGLWLSFSKSQAPGFVPQPGHKVRTFGEGFGFTVRGLVVNDVVIYYRTAAEEEAQAATSREQKQRERYEQYEAKGRAEQDAHYAALPAVFQRRLDKFRATREDFRWESEPYELFCCREAVKIIDRAKTSDDPHAFVRKFSGANMAEQKRLVPNLEYDDHSGNTFGFAVRLAGRYFQDQEDVVREHGALTPLVGCEEYGCPHPTSTGEAS